MLLNHVYHQDGLEGMPTIEAESVQCCVTSPPYYALRKYNVIRSWPEVTYFPGFSPVSITIPAMDCELGLEPSPEAYIGHLVLIFREVYRVLRNDGTLWLNIGDSYWGGKGKSGQAWSTENTDRETLNGPQHQISGRGETRPTDGKHPFIKPKDMIGIPFALATALRNDGWYWRQDIIWAKKNCSPESVTDRCTRSHEYIMLFSKSSEYYFDHEAIQEEAVGYDGRTDIVMKGADKYAADYMPEQKAQSVHQRGHIRWRFKQLEENGPEVPIRNKRSVWDIATKNFNDAHFATFPEKLVEPCIKAGSRPGDVVMDNFMGAWTTALVSAKLGRPFIGFEPNPEYNKIGDNRLTKDLGMFRPQLIIYKPNELEPNQDQHTPNE